ncbi:hypothetical protein PG995_014797 [Apiospora arundinis]
MTPSSLSAPRTLSLVTNHLSQQPQQPPKASYLTETPDERPRRLRIEISRGPQTLDPDDTTLIGPAVALDRFPDGGERTRRDGNRVVGAALLEAHAVQGGGAPMLTDVQELVWTWFWSWARASSKIFRALAQPFWSRPTQLQFHCL